MRNLLEKRATIPPFKYEHQMNVLAEKVALIVGAGSGIGRA